MLTLVWGRARAPHTRYLIENMISRAGAESCPAQAKAGQILLVPEPYSHESERMLCRLGGDAVSLSCEVLTFKRLAHRVLMHEGGLAEAQLDAGGRLLLLSRALELVRTELTHWGRSAAAPQFLERLLATIDELKAHEATPEMLSTPPAEHPSRAKLSDLRLIWEAFDALTARTALDPRDLPSRVADMLDSGTYAHGVRLYIDGFVSFTAQEHRILRAFLRHAEGVTVCITGMPADSACGDDAWQSCWEQSRLTADKLMRDAADTGRRVTAIVLPDDSGHYAEPPCSPMLRRVEANIMHDTVPDDICGEDGAVMLCRAPDMLSECEWAARLAREWVDGGLRYRDVAIAVPSWEMYGAMLESACLRHGLPLFSDNASPLSDKAVTRFLTASMRAVINGFQPEDMIALVKTGLAGLTADQSCQLEDYLRVHNIKGSNWTQDKPWTAHPSGWGARPFSGRDKERLAALNDMRVLLRGPLIALHAARRRESDVTGHARALYSYCEAVSLPQSLEKSCARLEERGLIQQAGECRQLWGIVCRSLDNCVDILGEQSCTFESFEQLLTLCLSQYQVSVIPVALDRLHAGPLDRLRRRGLKRLIFLGAAEPLIPRVSEAPGLLTDQERVLLEENGISLAPDADRRDSRELFTLYRCFALPSECLAVSYPMQLENSPAAPSVFFTRLERIAGTSPVTLTLPPSADTEWLSSRRPLSRHRAALLPSGCLSASRIETFQSCPFKYFARYELKARLRPQPGPQPADAGSMLHAVLEGMVASVMKAGGFRLVGRDAALEFADSAAVRYITGLPGIELRTARVERLLTRLRQTALLTAGHVYDELCRSDFTPLAAELPFTSRLSSGALPLRGVIDRVDGWLHNGRYYLRVVDYKSGAQRFSLGDVWHGLGIQMLCYLFSLREWEGVPAQPSGVLYLPAHDRYTAAPARGMSGTALEKLRRDLLRRDGLLLDDAEVLDAMEHGSDKLYLPVNYKDGRPGTHDKVATYGQMERLGSHVAEVMRSLSERLLSGDVSAEPVVRGTNESSCDYCDVRQACLFDARREKCRFLMPMSRSGFWEALSQKEETIGGVKDGL